MGRSAASKLRRKSQREASELRDQSDATLAMEEEELAREEEDEIVFKRRRTVPDTPRASRDGTPAPDEREEGHRQVEKVMQLVQTVREQITALVLDNSNIRAACDDLRKQCHIQGVAFADLSRMVNQTRDDQEESRAYSRSQSGPHPHIRQELLDAEGNLRAQDIGISWQDGETFLHGVRITGQRDAREEDLRRPATAEPYPSCQRDREDIRRPATAEPYPSCQRDREDAYRRPAMSTPYQQSREQPPRCIEMSDTPAAHFAVPRQDGRPSHRPAAPIQRFNSKNIGWPAWFRHFKAVADVQGWDKDQRALQMVSYLDEKAMNVAQELSDRELYDYDALVGLLSARFDPASRVSASRSRFHGRTRRHQEDADTYADAITELCRLGYPQSSPELRQELISETADFDRSLYGLCQLEQFTQCAPSGGTGVCVRGGRRPGGGDVRRGGPTAVEHAEGGGTTSVTGTTADVRSCASHGLRDATNLTTFRRPSTDTGLSPASEQGLSRSI